LPSNRDFYLVMSMVKCAELRLWWQKC